MKCKECPLCDCYRCSYEYDEYDIRCLANTRTQEFPKKVDTDYGGCRRTNKWILAQNKEDLMSKYLEYDAKCLEEYIKEHGWDKQEGDTINEE